MKFIRDRYPASVPSVKSEDELLQYNIKDITKLVNLSFAWFNQPKYMVYSSSISEVIFADRLRCTREDNVFTPVCDFVRGGVGWRIVPDRVTLPISPDRVTVPLPPPRPQLGLV